MLSKQSWALSELEVEIFHLAKACFIMVKHVSPIIRSSVVRLWLPVTGPSIVGTQHTTVKQLIRSTFLSENTLSQSYSKKRKTNMSASILTKLFVVGMGYKVWRTEVEFRHLSTAPKPYKISSTRFSTGCWVLKLVWLKTVHKYIEILASVSSIGLFLAAPIGSGIMDNTIVIPWFNSIQLLT